MVNFIPETNTRGAGLGRTKRGVGGKLHALRLAMMCNKVESHVSCAQICVAGLQTSTLRNQVSSQVQAHKMTTTTPHVQAPTIRACTYPD